MKMYKDDNALGVASYGLRTLEECVYLIDRESVFKPSQAHNTKGIVTVDANNTYQLKIKKITDEIRRIDVKDY